MKHPPPDHLPPEDGWTEFTQWGWFEPPNYLLSESDSHKLKIKFYHRPEDNAVVGKAWFGPGAIGVPGHAHGGSIAALLDQIMGMACWLHGHMILAAKMEVQFRNKLAIGTVASFEAWLERTDGKKLYPRARLISSEGIVFSESTGLFIKVSPDKFAELGKM
jgi:acyl-coenzyme A thioesterase PaaI-like protein